MKCKRCGTEFYEGIFCPECGTQYDEVVAKQTEQIMKEELKDSDEILGQEKELEIAKARAEQDRQAAERAEKEAELLRQQNESIRIQQELKAKQESEDKRILEENSRTFNGVVYNSVEERNNAQNEFERIKMADKKAIASFVLGLAVIPLTFTVVLWLPAMIVSVVFAVNALKEKTTKDWAAKGGLIAVGVFVAIMLLGLIFAFM